MTATVGPAAERTARLVAMYDRPSDVDAFERHYNRDLARTCRGTRLPA
ncbi:hypothetical protein AB0L06_08770 [Spirillospora sp. NPDC052269]